VEGGPGRRQVFNGGDCQSLPEVCKRECYVGEVADEEGERRGGGVRG